MYPAIILVAVVLLLLPMILAIVALASASTAKQSAKTVEEQIADLQRAIERLMAGANFRATPPESVPESSPSAQHQPLDRSNGAEEEEPTPLADDRMAASMPAPPPDAPTVSQPEPQQPKSRPSFEEIFTSRWLVWLGGIALIFGGAFLVKMSIDQRWVTPAVRIVAGAALAVSLLAAGEWLRRRILETAAARKISLLALRLPAALSAAGASTAFSTTYAAYQLYDLLSAFWAFGLLALIALITMALSFRQGRIMALLGLAGGYAVPLLVGSNSPDSTALFSYLSVILIASAMVAWNRARWWWFSISNLAGGISWACLWIAKRYAPSDEYALSAFLLLILTTFALLRHGESEAAQPSSPFWKGILPSAARNWLFFVAASGTGAGLFFLGHVSGYPVAVLVAFALAILVCVAVSRGAPSLELTPMIVGLFVCSTLANWAAGSPLDELSWIAAGVFYAALFGFGGFSLLWSRSRPGLWAGTSVGFPSLIAAIGFSWGVGGSHPYAWAGIGLVLAMAWLAAASTLRSRQKDLAMPLAIYAVGVTGGIAFALSIGMVNAWLPVALGVEVAAIAWVYQRLPLFILKILAIGFVAAVEALLLYVSISSDFAHSGVPAWSWILVAYGVPIVSMLLAANWFGGGVRSPTTILLHQAALTLLVLLVGLEIRYLVDAQHQLFIGRYGFVERSLQPLSLLLIAATLRRLSVSWDSPVITVGWKILFCIAVGHLALFALIDHIPQVFGGFPFSDRAYPERNFVGTLPLLNLIAVSYLLPAFVCALLYLGLTRDKDFRWRIAAGISSLALFFLWINLEVRNAFHDGYLWRGATTSAEQYAYSAIWMICGAAFLGLAIWRRSVGLRYASLTFIVLAIGKVFLLDMAQLSGLFRAGSFLALGICLVAIGFLYQRFVFTSLAKAGAPHLPPTTPS